MMEQINRISYLIQEYRWRNKNRTCRSDVLENKKIMYSKNCLLNQVCKQLGTGVQGGP